jgi:hypothetical protein
MADGEWNPVEALKAQYPQMGMSDGQIMQTLQDPAKFRSAFPQYTDVTDDMIRTNMGKFAMRHPEYAPPPTLPGPPAPQYGPEGLERRPDAPFGGTYTGPGASAIDRPVRGRDLIPGAVVGGALGAYAAPTALPGTVAWLKSMVRPAIATYALSKAQDLPGVGPFLKQHPMIKWLPWLAAGSQTSEKPPFKDPGAPLPEMPPEELTQAAPLSRGGGKPAVDPRAGLGQIPVAPPEPAPTYSGAPYPSAPSTELQQARSLTQQPRAPVDPAAGLGQIPSTPQPGPAPSEPQPAPRTTSQAEFRRQLDQALPTAPQPGQPIYPRPNAPQMQAAPTPEEPIPSLTPVEGSSAVEGYHYDPQRREFSYKEKKSGITYVFGDVDPETAQKFEQAESKGRALDSVRKQPGAVHVAKIINGKRHAVIPTTKINPF